MDTSAEEATPERADTDAAGAVSLHVSRGAPTPEELAAVMAVVTAAYAGEVEATLVDERPARTAWSRSTRGLRRVPDRDAVWGRFEGR